MAHTYKVDGKAIDLSMNTTQKTATVLEKLGPGELLTTRQLAKTMGLSYSHFRTAHAPSFILRPYRIRVAVKGQDMLVWGNTDTIAELKRGYGG